MGGVALTQSSNSPSSAGQTPAWISKGTVSNVDLRNYTIDVVAEHNGQNYQNLGWASPYFHTNNGEGFTVVPEIGAICLICQPSDEDTPYVLGFLGSFELEFAQLANLEDRAGEAATETEETAPATPTSTTSTGSADQKSGSASARAGRPYLNQGDMMMQTRDKNFLILRRGGVVQIGATPTCQTIYLPLLNHMRQFCENYDLTTPGGMLEWDVRRVENDPGGKAQTFYRLALRDKAQNDKADIQIKVGHVDDDIRYEMVVKPEGINVNDGDYSSPTLRMTISKNGNQSFVMDGSLSYEIKGDRSVKISGSDSVEVTGDRSLKAKSETTELTLAHILKSASSTETITGTKTINAKTVLLGSTPAFAVVLGEALVAWLAAHTHPVPGAPDPKVAALVETLSHTVRASK